MNRVAWIKKLLKIIENIKWRNVKYDKMDKEKLWKTDSDKSDKMFIATQKKNQAKNQAPCKTPKKNLIGDEVIIQHLNATI